MGDIHRVIPADKQGDIYWFHGPGGSQKTKLALSLDVPNKVILDHDDFQDFDKYELLEIALVLSRQGLNIVVASRQRVDRTQSVTVIGVGQ